MRELGRGNFGVTMLMQDLQTSEYVAAKFIQRGAKVGIVSALAADDGGRTDALHTHCDPLLQINVNVERELLNHRPLLHAHIIRFREVPSLCGECVCRRIWNIACWVVFVSVSTVSVLCA